MELYKVESCRGKGGCPRAVGDTVFLKNMIERIFKETCFTEKRYKQLAEKPKQHHVFRLALAGCANGCSQPQIKDFALIAKALPQINHEICTLCGQCINICKEEALDCINGQLSLSLAKCLG